MQNRFFKSSVLTLSAVLISSAMSSPAHSEDPALSFYPAKPWQVASTAPQNCNIKSEYNNGFILQFNGANKSLQSMNIDFRQSIFTTGQNYNVNFTIPGHLTQTVNATATSDSTLALKLSDNQKVYKATQTSATLDLDVEGNAFRFYLVGFGDASKGFDQCMTGNPAPVKPPTAEIREAKAPPSPVVPMPEKTKKVEKIKTPEVKVNKTTASAKLKALDKVEPASAKASSSVPSSRKLEKLERQLATLEAENKVLSKDLEEATKRAESNSFSLSSENWNLERATMRYNEAERQLDRIGKQLARERAECQLEKRELEAMLFDPQVTSEEQMAKLSRLENQIEKLESENDEQRIRYETRIRILEEQLGTN